MTETFIEPPANLGFGQVVWQAGGMRGDGPDAGNFPDIPVLKGTITFTPTVSRINDATASPNPITLLPEAVVGVLDEEGYLCTPVDPSATPLVPAYRGVWLVATDDSDLNPVNWTYTVNHDIRSAVSATKKYPLKDFYIAVPAGATVDLAVVSPADAAQPIGIPAATAAAARAEAAASEAAADAATAAAAIVDSDAFVAGRISTTGTATKTALTSAIAASTVLIPLSSYLAPGQAMPNDFSTNAAPLIQAAMDDLVTKANGPQPFGQICYRLDLGPGGFHTNAAIRIGGLTPATSTAHVGITGAGRDKTFILPQGNTSGIIFNAPADGTPAASDCHFSDFTLDLIGATHDLALPSIKGFIGRGWQDCTFSRGRTANTPHTAVGTDFPIRCTFTAWSVKTTGPGVAGTLDMPGGVIDAAKNVSGFGIGFGVFDNESVIFDGCDATDCYRGGFFFEAFESGLGHTKRTAVIKMIGCRSWGNRIGVSNVGSGSLVATGCEFTDNTVAGYYGGVSGGTTQIASLNTTLDNCQILRNGYGIYSTGDFTGAGHNYTALRDVLGGYRILNCRIEDNTSGGFVAERFNTVEAGGLTIRGNHFRRNGSVGMLLQHAAAPVRDLVIEDNYFDANDHTGLKLLVAMNAPKITGNTFANAAGVATQTVGIQLHPAEPVLSPRITNTFRRMTTAMANTARLDLTGTGDRVLDATADPDSPWLYREAFYGGSGTAWPVSGDGWAKNTGGSNADWSRATVGIAKGGSGTAISYIYRDLGTTGLYVSSRITSTTDDPSLSQFIGVMLSLASSSARTAVVAGVNKSGVGNAATSDFYALWQVVGGTWTLLWESTVPYSEGHAVALSRLAGSTVTNMYIDGELVHSQDVSAVASTSLAGVSSVIVTNQKRFLTEFRAMPFIATAPLSTTPLVAAGGVVDGAGATLDVDGNRLSAGQSTIGRDQATASLAMTSGSLRLTYFTARRSETLTSVRMASAGAAGATPTLVRIGLYSVAADGSLTLIASTASDTTLFAGTSTMYTKALSAGVAVTRGSRYAFGVLIVTAAATPTIPGYSLTLPSSELGQAPRIAAKVDSQTDLPSTIAAGSLSDTSSRYYGVLVP